MITDLQNRDRLVKALELVEQVAADHQSALEARAAATLNQNPGPIGVGRMLALSRDVEKSERIAREIRELLGDCFTTPQAAAAEARAA